MVQIAGGRFSFSEAPGLHAGKGPALLTDAGPDRFSGASKLNEPRDHTWYRGEAKRLRDKADAVQNDDALRNSYLSLAREYDRLADTLENRHRPAPQQL